MSGTKVTTRPSTETAQWPRTGPLVPVTVQLRSVTDPASSDSSNVTVSGATGSTSVAPSGTDVSCTAGGFVSSVNTPTASHTSPRCRPVAPAPPQGLSSTG